MQGLQSRTVNTTREQQRRRAINQMAPRRARSGSRIGFWVAVAFFALASSLGVSARAQSAPAARIDSAQAPGWDEKDRRFFLHGSMSTEILPDVVLTAFQATFPELFPARGLGAFGLIDDPDDDLPVGVSRREVPHLGGLPSVGVNCAACHVREYAVPGSTRAALVFGSPAQFDPEAFYGAMIAATFQARVPENMRRFLNHYLAASDSSAPASTRAAWEALLAAQHALIADEIERVCAAERNTPGDRLFDLSPEDVRLTRDRAASPADVRRIVGGMLRMFHNMRAAVHAPHSPPATPPPRSGPGRNNAFGLLSAALFGEPTVYAPVKFGIVWNLENRTWVHWDANTRSPILRNLAASLGLGAPMIGKRGMLDLPSLERHTRLSEGIRPPRYPFHIDTERAERGKAHFEKHCASCHPASGSEERLFSLAEIRTDANRITLFNPHQAELFNKFFAELVIDGYKPPASAQIRSTGKYVAANLAGVWARSPYLHNGSVRTMLDLLSPADKRACAFHCGGREYDERAMGMTDEGPFLFDATTPGNSSAGHEYGVRDLSDEQKRELIEYLKTL